jgi:transcriptional regulator with XRE-family HTH domain
MTLQKALKDWRRRRGFSQERLGFEANVSARHIAFIETGRSRPSREMVVRLSDALDVPRTDRNMLLEAAGFAPLYKARNLSDVDMQIISEGLHFMLTRFEPYPAFVIDRHWHLMKLNRVAELMFAEAGVVEGDSLLEALLAPNGLRQAIANWDETARYFAQRLRTESRYLGADDVLLKAAEALSSEVGYLEPASVLPAVVHTRYRTRGHELSFYSTIAQLGSAEDIALADLRIELLFPSDVKTRTFLEGAFMSDDD